MIEQSFNVNYNKPEEADNLHTYLDYLLLAEEDKELKNKLDMLLNELYLKHVVLRESDVVKAGLPFAPLNCAFVRRGTHEGNSYSVLLHFNGDNLQFVDCRDPKGKRCREKIAATYNLDWEEMYEHMRTRRKERKTDDEDYDKDVFEYYVILAPGHFIEIEDCEERVLYDYEKIVSRREEREQKEDYQNFKVASRYDEIRKQGLLSYSDLQTQRLLSGEVFPQNEKEAESLKRYRQLEDFDAALDKLCRFSPQISFADLSTNRFAEALAPILGAKLKPNSKGNYGLQDYNSKLIVGLYQRLGRFPSSKEADLLLYEGIWYTNDNCYMVGAAESLKANQPRAHLIRRFHDYTDNEESFDIEPFIASTSVKFVRLNQFTVFPYYFHLIDIFIKSKLCFLVPID